MKTDEENVVPGGIASSPPELVFLNVAVRRGGTDPAGVLVVTE